MQPFQPHATEFSIQNAYILARASANIYRNANPSNLLSTSNGITPGPQSREVRIENSNLNIHTHASILADDAKIMIIFKGTNPSDLRHILTDLRFDWTDGPFGQIHSGFASALAVAWNAIRQSLREFHTNNQRIWLSGHSLGGALATLAAAALLREDPHTPIGGVYTFGQPRVGDETFQHQFNTRLGNRTFRFVHHQDIITRLPPKTFGYHHVGEMKYIDRDGRLLVNPPTWFRWVEKINAGIEGGISNILKRDLTDHAISGNEKRPGYLEHLKCLASH